MDSPNINSGGSRVMALENVDIHYGKFKAVRGVNLDIEQNKITAFIGPSGCGKSTILRSLNRLNDLIKIFHLTGRISYHGQNLYAKDIDPVRLRKHIGMVFQRPNPFPKTIYDNVAYGARINGYKGDLDELVETCLRRSVTSLGIVG